MTTSTFFKTIILGVIVGTHVTVATAEDGPKKATKKGQATAMHDPKVAKAVIRRLQKELSKTRLALRKTKPQNKLPFEPKAVNKVRRPNDIYTDHLVDRFGFRTVEVLDDSGAMDDYFDAYAIIVKHDVTVDDDPTNEPDASQLSSSAQDVWDGTVYARDPGSGAKRKSQLTMANRAKLVVWMAVNINMMGQIEWEKKEFVILYFVDAHD